MNKDRNFYEITNGKCGESYIRRYVWARDTEEISKLMREDPQLEMRGFTIKFLFKGPYQRSEEARRMHGTGMGLGLYLANLIVQAHGGKIWAESKGKRKGSTFYIELPIR